MKIKHPALTSSIYELAKVFEMDIQLEEHAYSLRIELFRNTEHKNKFRCHAWELEMFRLVPSFPRNVANEPTHICDDTLMVDRGVPRSHIRYPHEDIVASDADAALEIVLNDLKAFLEHATSTSEKTK